MLKPPDRAHPIQAVPLNWTVLPAIGVCLLLILLSEARKLGEIAGWLIVLTVVIAAIGMRIAPKDASRTKRPALTVSSRLILFFVGAFLTAVFWHRAWITLPAVWGTRPLMVVTQIVGFWWPAILFAALCRHTSERFRPVSRGRFVAQLWWGLAGSVGGLFVQIIFLGIHEGWT